MIVVDRQEPHTETADVVTMETMQQHRHYRIIARAIDWLGEHQQSQPTLDALARAIGMSEFHLQRVFSDWAGISPKQFIQFLTLKRASRTLQHDSVLATALDSGLSGSGRLHDLTVNLLGATPGEIKSGGEGLVIEYGTVMSPFGWCFIATTSRGICKLGFIEMPEDETSQLEELATDWPMATKSVNQQCITDLAGRLFNVVPDRDSSKRSDSHGSALKLYVKGSPFQIRVWQALLEIPSGHLVSYAQVARSIEQPAATRAVASAIARNHIGWLIPCHRVIRQTGEFGQYRWNPVRKQAMISYESLSSPIQAS